MKIAPHCTVRITPRWDEHSVPFCTDTCPAFGSCPEAICGDVCMPAARAVVLLDTGDYASRYLQREVEAERARNGSEP